MPARDYLRLAERGSRELGGAGRPGWSLILLARHPDVRARVEAELDAVLGARAAPRLDELPRLPLTLAVLKEALRLYPPAYMMGRGALSDLTIGGYRMRKGQIAIVNVAGIHRRPDLHDEPDRFDPERFMAEREALLPRHAYLPFGAGPRMCIGEHLAMTEAQLLLAPFVKGARFEVVAPERPIALEPLITLRPKAPIDMRVTSRAPRALAHA